MNKQVSNLPRNLSRLRLRVTPSGRVSISPESIPSTALNRQLPTINPPSSIRARKKASLLHFGSVTIRLHKTSWHSRRHRKKYFAYTLAWRDLQGTRRREKRSSLELAKKRAAAIAEDIQTGEALLGQFTQADRASLARALELLVPIGSPPLELVVSTYVQLVLKLSSALSANSAFVPSEALSHAIDFFLEHQPRGVAPKTIPELVQDLLAEKRSHKRGSKWLGTLEQQLTRFAAKFTSHLHAVPGHEIATWLDGLKTKEGKSLALWTRANYRAAVRELVRFAQAKGQLSKAWDELKHVDDPEPPPVEVEIYSNAQLAKLLAHTRPNMIPFTVLTAFAGIRHEEMTSRDPAKPVLDWRDIKLDRAKIIIRSTVAKIKKRRLIHIHPNLVAWLRPHAQREGPICPLAHPSNALVKAKRRAGLPSARGELTNALRSSFISNRLAETNDIGLTAREAGNSPQIIVADYLELVDPEDAKAYFEIHPPAAADVLPLFTWRQHTR